MQTHFHSQFTSSEKRLLVVLLAMFVLLLRADVAFRRSWQHHELSFLVVLECGISASSKEFSNNVEMAVGAGPMKGCVSTLIHSVHVVSRCQTSPNRGQVSSLGCFNELRHLILSSHTTTERAREKERTKIRSRTHQPKFSLLSSLYLSLSLKIQITNKFVREEVRILKFFSKLNIVLCVVICILFVCERRARG